MDGLTRASIVDDVVERLVAAGTPAGERIKRFRTTPATTLSAGKLPAVHVYVLDEQDVQTAAYPEVRFLRSTTLTLDCIVEAASDDLCEAALWALVDAVDAALLDAAAFARQFEAVASRSLRTGITLGGESFLGQARIQITLQHRVDYATC